MLETPILFIVFNKTDTTRLVFAKIREQKPAQLFIAADGPRAEKIGEADKCSTVRSWVLDNIDWDCEVKTLFREQNVGCGRGPSEAITWFFEHVEEGIILEDDCLPNQTFFMFCSELLEKYRSSDAISIISGNNFQPIQPMELDSDYYYSIFPSSNGWATWRRTWQGFDLKISGWPATNKKSLARYLFREPQYASWWINYLEWIYTTQPTDMWDFQFHCHCMLKNQLAVIPKANLISNIGYGPDATHSQDPNNYFANLPRYNLTFPLRHPRIMKRNYQADVFIQTNLFGHIEQTNLVKKGKRFLKKFYLTIIKRVKVSILLLIHFD